MHPFMLVEVYGGSKSLAAKRASENINECIHNIIISRKFCGKKNSLVISVSGVDFVVDCQGVFSGKLFSAILALVRFYVRVDGLHVVV